MSLWFGIGRTHKFLALDIELVIAHSIIHFIFMTSPISKLEYYPHIDKETETQTF